MALNDPLPDPLLDASPLPLGAPAFDRITPDLFLPALRSGIAQARAEIDAIAGNLEPATFANTIEALERAGEGLARARRIFWTLASAQAVPDLQAIEAEAGALLTRHANGTAHDPKLFRRIDDLWTRRAALGLDEAQMRLLERSRRGFVDGGALLGPADKARFAGISERLAALATQFGQNVLAASADWSIQLNAQECAGLSDAMFAATARRAEARGAKGHLVTLDRGDVEAFLATAERRDLRETVWRAFVSRNDGGAHDNRAIVTEILALRQDQARLLGHATYADFALADTMAGTPAAAEALLMRVWKPTLGQVERERVALQALADADGVTLQPWDWRFYAEQVRRSRYALDENAVRGALTLAKVRDAAFHIAGRLYGLTFVNRDHDLPTWHADVRAWEVQDVDGEARGLLYTDYFARREKHGGAWMGSLRVQEKLDGPVLPIIYLCANFAKAPDGASAGLSLDEARTIFHEFGHAMHGLLSDVCYPSQSGTSVVRDFVEFPSKFMEHWIMAPPVLATLGLPNDVITAIGKARSFGGGFATAEFLASAIIDLKLHQANHVDDAADFAAHVLSGIGMPDLIAPRHGVAHFTHVFDGGYASQYYGYLWSEVLDADAFEAFEEVGDIFNSALSSRFVKEILSRGDTRDPMTSFVAFRGHPPREEALLRARGLASDDHGLPATFE